MLSKGFVIPLSFASLPVISITFFDKKKRSRRRAEEDEVDVPPDGLSMEYLENLDLEQLESHSSRICDSGSDNDTNVIIVIPGWAFIPSITVSMPRKGRHAEPSFDTAEDEEIIEGIRKAPLPDTLFSPSKEYDRPPRNKDVAEFDPVTDAIIRPDADTESIVTPKAIPPQPKVGAPKRSERALPDPSSGLCAPDLDLDLDLDLDEKVPGLMGPEDQSMPEDNLIIPESPGPDLSALVPVTMDRDDLGPMLGGGLPRGSIVLIEGRKGSGVEQFVQRLTYGFLHNGVGVTYISTENATSDFIEQMYGSGFMMANHLLGRRMLYIPIDSLIRKNRTTAGYIDRLIRSPQLLNDVMIIDRLSTMTANDLDENGHLKLLSYLKGVVTTDRTVILVTDEKQNGIESIREEAQARMSMAAARKGGEATLSVHVLKYPETFPGAKQEILFKIEPGRGMVIQ
jgi:archaeal flagellar protein FlaH